MSIFGKLDAANIPTNPFYVEAGEYEAEVTKAGYKTKKDGVTRQLFIEYTITNEDSLYHNKKVSDFFDLVSDDMTQEKFASLPVDEQNTIQRNNSNIKRRLCGNASNSSQPGLGVDMNDLNDVEWSPEVLQGLKVNVAISNYGADNQGVNIKWVNLSE